MKSDLANAVMEPRRRQILNLIWDREQSAGDISRSVADITFGAVSQHLKILEKAGAVSLRKEGRFRYYRARKKDMGSLGRFLESLFSEKLDRLKLLAEEEEKEK